MWTGEVIEILDIRGVRTIKKDLTTKIRIARQERYAVDWKNKTIYSSYLPGMCSQWNMKYLYNLRNNGKNLRWAKSSLS